MSDYNWNESNYDPKTKDNVFNNDTTFSKKRFGELVNQVNDLTNNSGNNGNSGNSQDCASCITAIDASFDCNAPVSELNTPIDSAGVYVDVMYIQPPYPVALELPIEGDTFTFKGSVFESLSRGYATTTQTYLTITINGKDYYYGTSTNSMAYFFSGAHNVDIGTVRHFIGSSYGFRLESREELTSEDPDGPDIICTFKVIYCGGARLLLDSYHASDMVQSQLIDMSCLSSPIPTCSQQYKAKAFYPTNSASYTINFSTFQNNVVGYTDIVVSIQFNIPGINLIIGTGNGGGKTINLQHPDFSSNKNALGIIHMWFDGGLLRCAYSVVISPFSQYDSSYKPMSVNENYYMDRSLVLQFGYCLDSIRIEPPYGSSASSIGDNVEVTVHYRGAYSVE